MIVLAITNSVVSSSLRYLRQAQSGVVSVQPPSTALQVRRHVWRTRTSPRRRHSDDECRRKKTVAAGRRQGGWRPPLSRSNWRFWSAPSATGLSSLRCSR
uniref:Uncharacterized protein n=1 Tax=Zea mays TaxID=4577 RepID=A0A804N0N1_MAIZE